MKKFKDIKAIKTNPEPAKGKNVDPDQLGQYSAKYQVSESTASLNQYLSARGINPQFVSTATKIAHAKSAQFLKWKQDHMQRREDVQTAELTPEETVNEISMDNISPMMQAHVKAGRKSNVNMGTRMASPKPAFKPKPKPKKVGFFKRLFAGEEVQLEASKASKPTALERFRAAAAVREKKHNDIEKERQERLHFVHSKNPKFAGKSTAERKKMALGAYYGKQNEENIEEDVKDILRAVRGSKELVHKVSVNGQVKTIHKNKDSAKSAATTIKSKFPHLKVTINSVHEDMWQDPQAATQTPADGANGGNQVADRKRQMSKSARMIKDLYKRKGVVKEDMYDHEKEDKSVATYGKKPKMSQTDKKDSLGENKPQIIRTINSKITRG